MCNLYSNTMAIDAMRQLFQRHCQAVWPHRFGYGVEHENTSVNGPCCMAPRSADIGCGLVSGEIVCSDLTTDGVGDSTALPGLLVQIDVPVDLFLADGAYDGDPTCDLLLARYGEGIEIAIPPPKYAMLSPDAAQYPTTRDQQITEIKPYGRIAWQKTSGYNQRSRGETLLGRWKAVIGPKLKARSFENQKTEAKIGVRILNRMTALGRPNFQRTA
ncbi:MAG: hypothetical protein KJ834_07975 [Alphaproteobacteria bacterium]|nr:hypothetical protein [Alphaproteobacteria bacterium]